MVASTLRVEGADQFFVLARTLKEVGDKGLQREMYRGLNRAVKPLRERVKQSAVDTLPRKGGLGALVASTTKIRVQRRTGARSVGIKLLATWPGHDVKATDAGRLRHPLFGNRRHWYGQAVTPGWWNKPTDSSGPAVRSELLVAMDAVKRKIEE